VLFFSLLLSFVTRQKKVNHIFYFVLLACPKSTKRTRLDKNFWFSTGRIVCAIQAAPAHTLSLASVLLTNGLRCNPSFENWRNFYNAGPSYAGWCRCEDRP
ncbi:MAG TPA: hypothetical protein P5104_09560, partial [Bacteroidales bacterium]|nr:hypothetical protein [Bacteroidales bacterium]